MTDATAAIYLFISLDTHINGNPQITSPILGLVLKQTRSVEETRRRRRESLDVSRISGSSPRQRRLSISGYGSGLEERAVR